LFLRYRQTIAVRLQIYLVAAAVGVEEIKLTPELFLRDINHVLRRTE
jgi:hypothetical protein